MGETVTLHASPLVYQPVEGSAGPHIQADQFTLIGSGNVMQAIGEQMGMQLRLTGSVRRIDGGLFLEISDWQVDEFANYEYQLGTIRLSDGQTLFDTDLGETLLIPNAPRRSS